MDISHPSLACAHAADVDFARSWSLGLRPSRPTYYALRSPPSPAPLNPPPECISHQAPQCEKQKLQVSWLCCSLCMRSLQVIPSSRYRVLSYYVSSGARPQASAAVFPHHPSTQLTQSRRTRRRRSTGVTPVARRRPCPSLPLPVPPNT